MTMRPAFADHYVVAVETVDWFALRHALPRPDRPLQDLERAPAMCGDAEVFPLLVMGNAMLDFWGEESTCAGCRAAVAGGKKDGGGERPTGVRRRPRPRKGVPQARHEAHRNSSASVTQPRR